MSYPKLWSRAACKRRFSAVHEMYFRRGIITADEFASFKSQWLSALEEMKNRPVIYHTPLIIEPV